MDLPMAWPDQWAGVAATGARRTLIAIRTVRDLIETPSKHFSKERLASRVGRSRVVGEPKFGVADSFPRSPAKARRPGRIEQETFDFRDRARSSWVEAYPASLKSSSAFAGVRAA
jgi:hypothetical protein